MSGKFTSEDPTAAFVFLVYCLCIALLGRGCIWGVITSFFFCAVCTVHLGAVMVCHGLITKEGRVTTMLWYLLFDPCPLFLPSDW